MGFMGLVTYVHALGEHHVSIAMVVIEALFVAKAIATRRRAKKEAGMQGIGHEI